MDAPSNRQDLWHETSSDQELRAVVNLHFGFHSLYENLLCRQNPRSTSCFQRNSSSHLLVRLLIPSLLACSLKGWHLLTMNEQDLRSLFWMRIGRHLAIE